MDGTPSKVSNTSGGPGNGLTGTACGRAQLARLFRLVLMLQSERHPNARELAESCEVSRRTVYRDLEILAEAGIPVRFRRDRQGYQLAKGFFLPPTFVQETEALALLALSRQWMGGEGLGLVRHASSGALKVVQALAPEVRERVLAAAELFPEDSRSLGLSPDRDAIHATLLSALTQRRQLRVWYRATESARDECTKFGLYRLLLQQRHWFLVGRSSHHRRVEVIGLPWVQKVVLTDDPYTIPPRFHLERFLAQSWGVERDPLRYRVWLRISPRFAPEVIDSTWHRSQRSEVLADGAVELHFVVDGIEEILRWVLGFGDQIEVLAPPELRKRVHEVAVNLAGAHAAAGRGVRSELAAHGRPGWSVDRELVSG
jgi:predicted DNA-binding transcriptional regulator YafY